MAKEHSNDDIHAKLNLLVSEFKNMKEVRGSALSAQEEVKLFKKEKDVTWRFNGNRVQFEFNEDIAGSLKQIDWSIEHGKTGYGRELIAETLTNIQKQSKLIRIADTSEGGWDTVKLYESNPVASDSEDEAKINRAGNKAVKKKTNATKGKSSLMTSSRFHPYAAAPMRGLYGGGRGSLFEVTDQTTAADLVVRVQPVQEVVWPAENSRTSGETVHTSREVKTPRHSLPVPGPSSSPKRE
ncbi:hypothetical protein DPMN_045728 [Dreissena polymorpha]|uniref:Uncharacterized protein n=1 Tax=Dreissena polymorpha TaxID=45954 RepID=A0A9D4D4N2_DREPO|nr:hypothetical protein DPMN_045728 [Dreissena polymorpha]